MNRFRTLIVASALALGITAGVAGCGGDDSSDVDPQTVIDDTFSNDETVSSGDLSLSISGSAEGDQGGSFDASLSGPFQGDPDNPASIPQLDWTGALDFEAAGTSMSFEGALTVTEDNAFVEYGGTVYEVGTETFTQFKELAESAAAQQTESTEGQSFGELFTQGCETQLQAQGATDTSVCDIDFASWLGELENEGTEDIEGTDAVHISGEVDVEQMISDLVGLGTAVPDAGAAPTEEQLQQITDAVSEASFDLYSGTDDDILRGLDFTVAIDPSAIPDADAAGIESVDVGFEMRLGGVNEDQEISAPSDAQPIEDLLGQFGIDPSALGGLGGLGAIPGAPSSGSGSSGGSGGAQGTNAYLDCVGEATTSEEINACASEL